MRSSTAFVLATLAIGHVSAASHKHASFHARRSHVARNNEVDVKPRGGYDVSNVDWTKALENIDWSTVKYGASSTPAAAPVSSAAPASSAAPVSSAAAKAYVAPSSAVVVKSSAAAYVASTPSATPSAAHKPSSSAAASSKVAASSAKASASSASSVLLSIIDEAKLLALGFAAVGANALHGADAFCGDSGPYVAEVTNDSGEDLIFVAWTGATSWVNVHAPALSVSIPSGATKKVSFSSSFSGAMSAVYSDTELVNGQISNTWLELTTGDWTTYDVSREVNMSGHSISAVGPSCTSDMETCVFTCKSGNSCLTGYTLSNCNAANGGGAGTYEGAASGGCMMSGGSGTLKVTLS